MSLSLSLRLSLRLVGALTWASFVVRRCGMNSVRNDSEGNGGADGKSPEKTKTMPCGYRKRGETEPFFFHFSEKGIPVTWLKYSQIFGLRRSLSYTIRSLQGEKNPKTTAAQNHLRSRISPEFAKWPFFAFFLSFFSFVLFPGPPFSLLSSIFTGYSSYFFLAFFLCVCERERCAFRRGARPVVPSVAFSFVQIFIVALVVVLVSLSYLQYFFCPFFLLSSQKVWIKQFRLARLDKPFLRARPPGKRALRRKRTGACVHVSTELARSPAALPSLSPPFLPKNTASPPIIPKFGKQTAVSILSRSVRYP